jgi:hypothetical protein
MDPMTIILFLASGISFVLHALHLTSRYAVTAETAVDSILVAPVLSTRADLQK